MSFQLLEIILRKNFPKSSEFHLVYCFREPDIIMSSYYCQLIKDVRIVINKTL